MRQNNRREKINKTFVDSKRNAPGVYRDSQLIGFGLKVTPNLKLVYFAENIIRGTRKSVRFTIGKHGDFTPDQARERAAWALNLMARGISPYDELEQEAAEKKAAEGKKADEQKLASITLSMAFQDYLGTKRRKPSTVYGYEKVLKRCLGDWLNQPIATIGKDKDKVEERYKKLSDEHPAQANQVMRVLRALFNYANLKYENHQGGLLVPVNPVKRLSQTQSWNRIERRQSIVEFKQLSDWHAGVMALSTESPVRDYLILLLFTGLRKEEAASLKWENVDLIAKKLKVEDTKNHTDHILPMSKPIYYLLRDRWIKRGKNEFVFPGDGAKGYLNDPRKQMAHVTEVSKVEFMLHDLRRTFATAAKRVGIDEVIRKRLMNHKVRSSDVTEGYTVPDVEWLRKDMNKIASFLQSHINRTADKKVKSMRRRKVVPFRRAR